MTHNDVNELVHSFMTRGGQITVVKSARAAGVPRPKMRIKATKAQRHFDRSSLGYAILNYSKLTNR
jgi:hypothetical protein